MTDLADFQFELLPSTSAIDGMVFGIGADVSLDADGFLPGEDDWEDQDQDNPTRGGTGFGRDVLKGPTWGWNLHTNGVDTATALEALGRFKSAWRAKDIRQKPGAVTVMRYRLNGRYRRIWGRPRRLAAPPTNEILSGKIPITVDFKAADSYTYDDEDKVLTLTLQQGSTGGFVFPLAFPFTTLPVGLAQQQAVVGGDADTYPVVRFRGPVVNPSLETDDWTLALDLSIGAGDYVEVDLRPWAMTAMYNGDYSVAGALGRRQYMAKMKFQPGAGTMMVYRGVSDSTSSTCEVRWSDAWNSI